MAKRNPASGNTAEREPRTCEPMRRGSAARCGAARREGGKVTSRKQAIAIALSEARRKGRRFRASAAESAG